MTQHQRFADYILFQRVASTSFGDCFRAGQMVGTVVDRHILLQLFNGASLDAAEFWRLVADRTTLIRTLRDPYLGECLAFGRTEDTPYAAYAYSPGKSLRLLLAAVRDQRMPVPIDQALLIVDRTALGLTGAHQVQHRGRPVLHGFLVPDLVHVSGDGALRVLGIEAAPGLRSQLAQHPACAGYLAPEVRAGEPPAASDDVFSLAAVLFQLLTGKPLPDRPSDSFPEVVASATLAVSEEPLPSDIRALLASSLAPKEKRIPDVVDWQRELGMVLLDGGYAPTTFNLSLLMHTVFRSELEEELAGIPGELAHRLSLEAALPEEAEDSQKRTESSSTTEPTTQPSFTPAAAGHGLRHSFIGGFLVSFLSAALLLIPYFLLRGPDGATASEISPLEPALPAGETSPRDPQEPSAPEDRLEEPDEDAAPATQDDEPQASATVPEAPPRPQDAAREGASDSARNDDVEATVREEYERRLAELERQLAEARESATEPTARTESPRRVPAAPTQRNSSRAAQTAAGDRSGATPASTSVQRPSPAASRPVEQPRPASEPPIVRSPATPNGGEQPQEPQSAAPGDDAPAGVVYVPPQLEFSPQPSFPAAARRMNKEARVQVRVLIDEQGRVQETELPGPPAGFGFDRAATAAARRSRWTPATRDGEPVESWAILTIDFRL